MSKYCEIKTQIKLEEEELLIEAIKDMWPLMFGSQFKLSDKDIENHKTAQYLLGYQGDVRDGVSSSYAAAKGHIIIRGNGLNGASIENKIKAGVKATSVKVPGASNDFAIYRNEKTGVFDIMISDYDQGNFARHGVTDVAGKLLAGVAAKKIEKMGQDIQQQLGAEIETEVEGVGTMSLAQALQAAKEAAAAGKDTEIVIHKKNKKKPKVKGFEGESGPSAPGKPAPKTGPKPKLKGFE